MEERRNRDNNNTPSSTYAVEQRPCSEPLKIPDIDIRRTNSATFPRITDVRSSFSESVGSVSVRSLTMQLQRGKEREVLRARIAGRSNNDNKLAMTDRNSVPRFTTSMVQPLSSTSALLKAKGGTKYRHDNRHRAEVYAVNRLLRDLENGLYDQFIETMMNREAKGLSTDFKIDGEKHETESNGHYGDEVDDDDAKSDTSSVVPSPEQRKTVAGVILTPSSAKVVAATTSSPCNEDDVYNMKTTTPLKSKLSRMLNREDISFNAV